MAVILVEGFDHYSDVNAADKFWTGNIFGMDAGRGFYGGQSIIVIDANEVRKQLPASYSPVIFGAAIKVSDTVSGAFMSMRGGGAISASLQVSGAQRLQLLDSTGTAVGTGTTIVPINRWFYVELKLNRSGGHAEAHLNGAAEIASSAGTFGSSDIDVIEFSNHSLSGTTTVDDVIVLDTTGSSPQNDYIGDIAVETLYPVADGSYTAWTPKTGTDHYKMVNEHLIDGDTTYVRDATPTDKDTYLMDTFAGQIYAAQLNVGARKGEAALRQLKPLIRQGGVDYLGSLGSLSLDYIFYSWLLQNDPSGSPWLAATINADEFGQELIT